MTISIPVYSPEYAIKWLHHRSQCLWREIVGLEKLQGDRKGEMQLLDNRLDELKCEWAVLKWAIAQIDIRADV